MRRWRRKLPLAVCRRSSTIFDGLPAEARSLAAAIMDGLRQKRRMRPEIAQGETVAALEAVDCAPPVRAGRAARHLDRAARRRGAGHSGRANGAGKSTLGASLAGLLRLKGGRRVGPAGGMAFQNSENQFVTGTVRAEIEDATDRILTEAERAAARCHTGAPLAARRAGVAPPI